MGAVEKRREVLLLRKTFYRHLLKACTESCRNVELDHTPMYYLWRAGVNHSTLSAIATHCSHLTVQEQLKDTCIIIKDMHTGLHKGMQTSYCTCLIYLIPGVASACTLHLKSVTTV